MQFIKNYMSNFQLALATERISCLHEIITYIIILSTRTRYGAYPFYKLVLHHIIFFQLATERILSLPSISP